ncbi:hypothetical protein ASC87_25960 [Rhizobacter sp. Root1221]|nr:hypothetical protein ASC87_25960 [Rhizobacter sp. Root1221]
MPVTLFTSNAARRPTSRVLTFSAGAGLIASLLLPMTAQAFKIDTHAWIAQQVINDLEDDGRITIKLKGKPVTLPVPPTVSAAILANRDAFYLGNIGPDAFPDVVAGQTVVHPGLANGWKTNDWLKFVLTKAQGNAVGTAFAYGYLGHASADVFAHTYVNQYSGDIFELTDETLVEQRHIALESFISRRAPPMRNNAGQIIAFPTAGVRVASPALATFIRDALVMNEDVAAQYAKGVGTKYLPAYLAYRDAIDDAANSELWQKIDQAVLQIVASYNDIGVTDQQAGQLVAFMNDTVLPKVNRREDLDQAALNKLDTFANNFEAQRFSELNSALRSLKDLESRILSELAEQSRQRGRLCSTVRRSLCPKLDPVCNKFAEELVCPIDQAAHDLAAKEIDRINELVNGTNGLRAQMQQTATRVRDQAVSTKASSVALLNAIKDMQQAQTSNTSPVKAYLMAWRSNLDVAMREYVVAAGSSMVNTLLPSPSSLGPFGAFTPMSDWFDCYHLSIAGTPVTCAFYSSATQNWADLQKLATVLQDATSIGTYVGPTVGLPTPQQVREEVERLKSRATSELTAAGIRAVEDLLPAEIRDIVAVMGVKVDEAELRDYYTRSGSSKNLLMIPDIDTRVKAEMNLNLATNQFDPEKFAVVYNAVTLSKLALLDSEGLALLAQVAGVANRSDGRPLFTGTDNAVSNAFASIDGNHQWLTAAPPRPNAVGAPYRAVDLPGYPNPGGYASAEGFVPWRPEARDALFRALFIGPLSPGIESATDAGLPSLLRADYPYQPCRARPFPDGVTDRTCLAMKLMPVLSMILD